MFHGCRLDPDGAQAAADSTRSNTSRSIGSSVNWRTARRVLTASYTSTISAFHARFVWAVGFILAAGCVRETLESP
jgi:hypothetical protein